MKKYSAAVLMGLAIVIGLATSYVAYDWLQQKAAVEPVTMAVETAAVMVAVNDLPRGTVLGREMVRQVDFLAGSLPADQCFSSCDDLVGRVLIHPVQSGEPVFKSRVAPDNVRAGGVGAIISPNKRAMTVKVDKVKGVSGFVSPGNMVDVLVTLQRQDKNRTAITKTVLENVPVLAIGTELERKDDGQEATEVDVITLEVDPRDAEKLALASTQGTIQLAMRNHTDNEDVLTKGTTIETLLASYAPAEEKKPRRTQRVVRKPAPKKEEPVAYTVEVIKGSTVNEVRF